MSGQEQLERPSYPQLADSMPVRQSYSVISQLLWQHNLSFLRPSFCIHDYDVARRSVALGVRDGDY